MNTLHMNNARQRIAGSWLILCLVTLSGVPFVAVAGETLGYDLKGNIVSRQSASGTTNFQYDSLDRLTDEQGPQATQGFTYDPNGNRLTDGAGSYAYVPNSNVMATEHGNTVVHDAAGNMTDDGQGMTFEYNQAGRLWRVYDNSVLVATYTYNAMGQRTRKATPTGTTVYHYDLDGQLIEETLADGSPQTTYVWRDSRPTAVIYRPGTPSNSTAQEKVVYLHTDHLETPRSATDDTRTTVWKWESDAFGSTAADVDPDGDANQTVVNLRFPGQYSDDESGLHYNMTRYYEPDNGHYISPDPIGLVSGVNLYQYSYGNTLKYFDPLGLDPVDYIVGLSKQAYQKAYRNTVAFRSGVVDLSRALAVRSLKELATGTCLLQNWIYLDDLIAYTSLIGTGVTYVGNYLALAGLSTVSGGSGAALVLAVAGNQVLVPLNLALNIKEISKATENNSGQIASPCYCESRQ